MEFYLGTIRNILILFRLSYLQNTVVGISKIYNFEKLRYRFTAAVNSKFYVLSLMISILIIYFIK